MYDIRSSQLENPENLCQCDDGYGFQVLGEDIGGSELDGTRFRIRWASYHNRAS